jgi:ribosomal protein RSM22 (predicted rRNA methylase)
MKKEKSTNKAIRVISPPASASGLVMVEYLDEESKSIHPNAIAWVIPNNLEGK